MGINCSLIPLAHSRFPAPFTYPWKRSEWQIRLTVVDGLVASHMSTSDSCRLTSFDFASHSSFGLLKHRLNRLLLLCPASNDPKCCGFYACHSGAKCGRVRGNLKPNPSLRQLTNHFPLFFKQPKCASGGSPSMANPGSKSRQTSSKCYSGVWSSDEMVIDRAKTLQCRSLCL